ncbi:hypothetical protein C8R44DRAFT_885726 [Mycena epipterygia]|nr:hypothetical protein C8R44DRAFT_885726 [Mycena epipterygia]
MPPSSQPSIEDLTQYVRVAATALKDISDTTSVPFLGPISAVSLVLLSSVQDIKTNKERCVRILVHVHHLLCEIATLCMATEYNPLPKILDDIASLSKTLQKIQSCFQSQKELSKVKRFFKQSEIAAQLDACEAELQHAMGIFAMGSGTWLAEAVNTLRLTAEERHHELLELLEAQSDDGKTQSDTKSSISDHLSRRNTSYGSLSLLPASPKIFHGRESVMQDIIALLLGEVPRVAILGPGGIGKTTLATAVLHHADITGKYTSRHFVSCESARTGDDLIATLGYHLGLAPSKQLVKAIINHLSEGQMTMLVLDNLETPWEPIGSRSTVEEFLARLADVAQVAILITMRGLERPGRVKWTRPFIPPLNPLSSFAARAVFVDIADDPITEEEEEHMTELITLTGHHPLALSLMASVAFFEGYTSALSRWKNDSISLLSDGHDKGSSLEKSIMISLSSPRMMISSHAKGLLQLLSLLPDGISEVELLHSDLNIPEILRCRTTLLRTSLAYVGENGRLNMLPPIREYIRIRHPPSQSLVRPYRKNLQELLSIWANHKQLPSGDLVTRLSTNYGNVQSLMVYGLNDEETELKELAQGILHLDGFSWNMLHGHNDLLQYVSQIVQRLGDTYLRAAHLSVRLRSNIMSLEEADDIIREGVEIFRNTTDLPGAARFYCSVAHYYLGVNLIAESQDFCNRALLVATEIGDDTGKLAAIDGLRNVENRCGNYRAAVLHSIERQRVARLIGDFRNEIVGLADEAMDLSCMGHLPQAMDACVAAQKMVVDYGIEDSTMEIGILDSQAEIHLRKSEYAESRTVQEKIVSKTAHNKSPWYHINALLNMALIDTITGVEEDEIIASLATVKKLGNSSLLASRTASRASYEKSLCLCRGKNSDVMISGLEVLADLKHGIYSTSETFRWTGVYLALACKTQDVGHTSQALRCLGDIFLAHGEEETALSVFRAALESFTKMDIHQRRGDCMVRIGDIFMRRGDLVRAAEMWVEARPLFVRSSQAKDVADIDARLTCM